MRMRFYVKRTGYQTASEINAAMRDSRSGFLGAGRVTFDVIDRTTKSIAVNPAGNLCTGMPRGVAENMAKNMNAGA